MAQPWIAINAAPISHAETRREQIGTGVTLTPRHSTAGMPDSRDPFAQQEPKPDCDRKTQNVAASRMACEAVEPCDAAGSFQYRLFQIHDSGFGRLQKPVLIRNGFTHSHLPVA